MRHLMVQFHMQKLRGALIGYGFIMEKGHAAGYQQRGAGAADVEIVAIADISPGQREIAQASWPKARLYDDWRALLAAEADKLDFVDIATPPRHPAGIAPQALSRRLHVLCEKPPAATPHQARPMRRQAGQAGRG